MYMIFIKVKNFEIYRGFVRMSDKESAEEFTNGKCDGLQNYIGYWNNS